MSQAETPLPTDAQLIRDQLEKLVIESSAQNQAINALGENVQWIIDNINGLFQMFGSPQFMAMLPQMMSQFGGVPGGGPEGPDGPEGPADPE